VIGYIILGVFFFLTSIIAIIIALSAREIDFGERLLSGQILKRRKETIKRLEEKLEARKRAKRRETVEDIYPIIQELELKFQQSQKKAKEFYDKAVKAKNEGKTQEVSIYTAKAETYAKRAETYKTMLDEIKQKIEQIEGNKATIDEITYMLHSKIEPLYNRLTVEELSLEEEAKMDEDIVKLEKEMKEIFEEEPEEIKKEEMIKEKKENGYSRDILLRYPRNMCLDEVFMLEVSILQSEDFSPEALIKDVKVSSEEARRFAIAFKRLGKTLTEATFLIEGLKEGPLTIRPIPVGRLVSVDPQQRTIYFDPKTKKTTITFFLTPIRWTKDITNILRLEFEQEYRILKAIDLPLKIYKHKFEALFGINISKWQQYALIIYSALGTLAGLISVLQNKLIPFIQKLLA